MTNVQVNSQLATIPSKELSEVADYFEQHETEILATLPFFAAELASKTSLLTLIILIDAYGGGLMYLPKETTDDCKLVRLIGFRHAHTLIDEHGGCPILLPARSTVVRLITRLRVKSLIAEKLSASEIAKRLGVHQRMVCRLRAEMRRSDAKRIARHE